MQLLRTFLAITACSVHTLGSDDTICSKKTETFAQDTTTDATNVDAETSVIEESSSSVSTKKKSETSTKAQKDSKKLKKI